MSSCLMRKPLKSPSTPRLVSMSVFLIQGRIQQRNVKKHGRLTALSSSKTWRLLASSGILSSSMVISLARIRFASVLRRKSRRLSPISSMTEKSLGLWPPSNSSSGLRRSMASSCKSLPLRKSVLRAKRNCGTSRPAMLKPSGYRCLSKQWRKSS